MCMLVILANGIHFNPLNKPAPEALHADILQFLRGGIFGIWNAHCDYGQIPRPSG